MSRGNPYTTDSFPPHELTVRCLGAMTNGSFTPIAQMAGKEATYATLKKCAAQAGLYTPDARSLGGGIGQRTDTPVLRAWKHHGTLAGACPGRIWMGMEEHLPLTLITEQDLTSDQLKRLKY